ncbi:MAG: hypothetical protein ACI8PW_001880 [Methylophilaceae bacterium]|jgi:hypothetical protein
MANKPLPTWVRDDDSVVACTEKIRVMKDNLMRLNKLLKTRLKTGY